jgi:hypothetical protein
MQKRSLVALGVVFAALLAYVLLIEVGQEEQRDQRETLEAQILPTDADSIRSIRLEGEKGIVELELRGDPPDAEWLVVAPYEGPADPAGAQALARAVATLQERRLLEDAGDDLSEYGLDRPVLTVTLRAEGLEAPAVLRFGAETGARDGRYVQLEGDPVLRIVPAHQFQGLDKGVDDLRDKRLVRFSPGAAVRVALHDTDRTVTLQRVHGVWWVDGDPRYRARRMEVEDLLADLTTSRVMRFVDADDPALGLADSERHMEVELDDGEMVRVNFGAYRETAVLAQVAGTDEAAEISAGIAAPLDMPAAEWCTLEVADINPWQVSALTLEYGEQRFAFTADEDDEWTLAHGDNAPRGVEASRAREVLAQIDQFEGTGFAGPDLDTGAPVGSFEIVTEGQATVRFGLYRHGDDWWVRVDGDPVPMRVPETLGLYMEAFLADPWGGEA